MTSTVRIVTKAGSDLNCTEGGGTGLWGTLKSKTYIPRQIKNKNLQIPKYNKNANLTWVSIRRTAGLRRMRVVRQKLNPILSDLTKNKYVTKDSFSFADDVTKQNSELFMTSFDIDSLFTNLPLDETIDICIKKLFKGKNPAFQTKHVKEF